MGFVSVGFEVMADAFGDDLFSVFDEEQAGSSKKTTPKSVAQSGYVNVGDICLFCRTNQ